MRHTERCQSSAQMLVAEWRDRLNALVHVFYGHPGFLDHREQTRATYAAVALFLIR